MRVTDVYIHTHLSLSLSLVLFNSIVRSSHDDEYWFKSSIIILPYRVPRLGFRYMISNWCMKKDFFARYIDCWSISLGYNINLNRFSFFKSYFAWGKEEEKEEKETTTEKLPVSLDVVFSSDWHYWLVKQFRLTIPRLSRFFFYSLLH